MPAEPLFGPGALAFYAGLEADNTKAYFDSHREQYEREVREPIEAFVASVAADYGHAKVFRPNRDVRFAKDKSPYKVQQGAYLVARGGVGSVYVAVGADGVWAGGGMYEPSRAQLARMRAAIVDDRRGADYEALSADLVAGGLTFAGPDLKTAPRGYAKDHPRIALLRRTRSAALRRFAALPSRTDVLEVWERLAPLNAWLAAHVGPPDPDEAIGRRPSS